MFLKGNQLLWHWCENGKFFPQGSIVGICKEQDSGSENKRKKST